MKKNMLASMALGALLFVGCGSGVKDMHDTERKYDDYYSNSKNYQETYDKFAWCLENVEAPIKSFEELLKCKEQGSNMDSTCLSYEELDKKKEKIFKDKLDEVNALNCFKVSNLNVRVIKEIVESLN